MLSDCSMRRPAAEITRAFEDSLPCEMHHHAAADGLLPRGDLVKPVASHELAGVKSLRDVSARKWTQTSETVQIPAM